MPIINSVSINFANNGTDYESDRCKGFVLPQKSESDAKGNYPVMARLIIGRYSETAFRLKLRVPQSLWSSGRACGKSVTAREINSKLDEIRATALCIYAELSAIRENVTAEEVKHQLLGMASGQETLLSYYRTGISYINMCLLSDEHLSLAEDGVWWNNFHYL